jgi:hypothetical protein
MSVLILYSSDPAKALEFFTKLGLYFKQEKHDDGPIHWATEHNGNVFEIYPTVDAKQSRLVWLDDIERDKKNAEDEAKAQLLSAGFLGGEVALALALTITDSQPCPQCNFIHTHCKCQVMISDKN